MLSQWNEKSMQAIQKDFDKIIAGKEEEISRLRDHNRKFLLQIKKAKDKVHVKLVATRKVFLHACVLACRRLKLGNQLYLIYFS